MEFSTYILQSEVRGILYIGQTSNVEKRLTRHNTGGSRYTKGKGPWKLIYSVSFDTRKKAILLENKLKGFKNPTRVKDWIANHKALK